MSAPERRGRNIWLDDPENFERLRQNFTTSLLIHGPNMTLPDMSEKLCELHRELEQARARLAAAEAMAEALREARGGLEWAQVHLMESAGMSSVTVDTASDSVSAALAQWDAVKGGEG